MRVAWGNRSISWSPARSQAITVSVCSVGIKLSSCVPSSNVGVPEVTCSSDLNVVGSFQAASGVSCVDRWFLKGLQVGGDECPIGEESCSSVYAFVISLTCMSIKLTDWDAYTEDQLTIPGGSKGMIRTSSRPQQSLLRLRSQNWVPGAEYSM